MFLALGGMASSQKTNLVNDHPQHLHVFSTHAYHTFPTLTGLGKTGGSATPYARCSLPGDSSCDSDAPIQADGMNQLSRLRAKTSLAPQIRAVAPLSPVVSRSWVLNGVIICEKGIQVMLL